MSPLRSIPASAAGQRNQVGLTPVIQLSVPVGLGALPEGPFQPILEKPPLDPVHRARHHI